MRGWPRAVHRALSSRLWDIECGACLRVLEGHEELVRCIRFDNKRIVSGAYDGWVLPMACSAVAASEGEACPRAVCAGPGRAGSVCWWVAGVTAPLVSEATQAPKPPAAEPPGSYPYAFPRYCEQTGSGLGCAGIPFASAFKPGVGSFPRALPPRFRDTFLSPCWWIGQLLS